jgi:diguanylate cyclase (GGDEF)-like protein/PAS domain S-box-containing protein
LVARKWAYLLRNTTYIPLPYPDIEAELLGMVHSLFDTLLNEPFDATEAKAVGVRLVELNCVGEDSFQHTVDVLGKAMLGQPELRRVRKLPDRVITVLGALTSGYVEAVRRLTLAQQEDLNRTMITIGRDSRLGQRAAEARLEAILDSSSTGIAITDADGAFLRTNHALGSILGHSASEFAELTVFDLLPPDEDIFVRTARDQLLDGTLHRMRQRRTMLTKAGDAVPVTIIGTLLREQDEPHRIVLLVQDDSELRLLQSQLTRQSLHDVVTGLPNRQFFTTRLESALLKADPRTGTTVYHLDLDAFAMVSDGLSRQVGDQVLKAVAERLKVVVAGEKSMVARLDSDEFAILIENSAHTPDVATMIDRVNDELGQSVYVDGENITVSASIGVVDRPRRNIDPTELLRASDLALRRAKRHGRRQWELFDDALDEQDRAHFNLATTMPAAWEVGDVRLDYRPQVDLVTGAVVALEPVLRWDHPRFGPVGHRRCVELAEQTGLMLSLGDWLLHSACAQVRKRRRESDLRLPMVVELSDGQAVDPDLVGRVLRILAEDDMAPDDVRLGIPVHLLHGDRPEPAEHLRVLSDAGVGVALHGFGSAATDLPWLEDLPVPAVRIGVSLVAAQAARAGSLLDVALTDLVDVIHSAGGTVAVDGIDTVEQANWWREAGADTGLGHQFTTSDQ